jgi:hypothetical protein
MILPKDGDISTIENNFGDHNTGLQVAGNNNISSLLPRNNPLATTGTAIQNQSWPDNFDLLKDQTPLDLFSDSLAALIQTWAAIKEIGGAIYKGFSLVFPSLEIYMTKRRLRNLIMVLRNAQEMIEKYGLTTEQVRYCSEKIGIPLLENASLEEDDGLRNIYAALLYDAIHPNGSDETMTLDFINTVKQLSSANGRIFRYIARERAKKDDFYINVDDIADKLGMEKEEISMSFESLERLGLISTQKLQKLNPQQFYPTELSTTLGRKTILGKGPKYAPNYNTIDIFSNSAPYLTKLGESLSELLAKTEGW